mmetsp:Transcript_10027/g.11695  ORF Transcript_10027/g.11695 Transcript_10027/m.11695 type:complete len:159 (+) Transcript_10027:107-583(+)|eukprot:CAMPEP_0197864454 /NCGR_PEP_ID=MMETSP1438-20131217/42710_1 /TAXON_ID=1461541 /ORGANISM="Pterosperma sp., Strain CCMP1384" /LENGTH=158 /DNA_ID=CAMNT_0043482707 /DNA_START=99 /DNA_END=575 /DNA_ORIENTATION=-
MTSIAFLPLGTTTTSRTTSAAQRIRRPTSASISSPSIAGLLTPKETPSRKQTFRPSYLPTLSRGCRRYVGSRGQRMSVRAANDDNSDTVKRVSPPRDTPDTPEETGLFGSLGKARASIASETPPMSDGQKKDFLTNVALFLVVFAGFIALGVDMATQL